MRRGAPCYAVLFEKFRFKFEHRSIGFLRWTRAAQHPLRISAGRKPDDRVTIGKRECAHFVWFQIEENCVGIRTPVLTPVGDARVLQTKRSLVQNGEAERRPRLRARPMKRCVTRKHGNRRSQRVGRYAEDMRAANRNDRRF